MSHEPQNNMPDTQVDVILSVIRKEGMKSFASIDASYKEQNKYFYIYIVPDNQHKITSENFCKLIVKYCHLFEDVLDFAPSLSDKHVKFTYKKFDRQAKQKCFDRIENILKGSQKSKNRTRKRKGDNVQEEPQSKKQKITPVSDSESKVSITQTNPGEFEHFQFSFIEALKKEPEDQAVIGINNLSNSPYITRFINEIFKTNPSKTPLLFAMDKEYVNLVKKLIELGAGVNFHGKSAGKSTSIILPLHRAIEIGNTEIIKLLIENKANINAKNSNGETSLCVALRTKNLAVTKYLVETWHVDLAIVKTKKKINYSALDIAHSTGDESLIKYIKSKMNVDISPLRIASDEEKIDSYQPDSPSTSSSTVTTESALSAIDQAPGINGENDFYTQNNLYTLYYHKPGASPTDHINYNIESEKFSEGLTKQSTDPDLSDYWNALSLGLSEKTF
jgi:ankyrin repeat protein